MATKKTEDVEAAKPETITFEFRDHTFLAVKDELESYETNKQVELGGPSMYAAFERIFAGNDVTYAKLAGGSFGDMIALVNAAFAAAAPKAKN